MRLAGERLTCFVSVSAIQASGSTPLSLQVSTSEPTIPKFRRTLIVADKKFDFPDRALDGSAVDLDATVVEEAHQAISMTQAITDRIGEW
jgi:hypothetical protein